MSKAELLRQFARERVFAGPVRDDDPIWQLCGRATGRDAVSDEHEGRVSQ